MNSLTGVVLAGGVVVNVSWDGETIVAVEPLAKATEAPRLLIPAFIDTHIHLDKALIRDGLVEHDGTLAGAIGAIHERKSRYTAEDVRNRARAVVESAVMTGTTRLRSHVDVDTIGGLTPLEGVMAAANDCRDIADVRTIAFPQEGILRDPGSWELMHEAMAAGADVVGGMPHHELDDRARAEHVRLCFELAERFDRDVDMHVDETDDASVRTLEMVADEALARGWIGRVTAGHVCSLGPADHDYAQRVIEKCARADITIVSNPVTNLVLQGRGDRGLIRRGLTRVAEFRAAGVNLAFGQDCVGDGFYPFGRADMLEVALISAHAAHLTSRADLAYALEAVTEAPARAWRLADYGIRAGARADFALYSASTWPEALRLQHPPDGVWFRGREVARTTLRQQLLRDGSEGGAAATERSTG
jgi:cytosine deaminase